MKGVTHGRRYSYNRGCRCVPCTAANREAVNARLKTQQDKPTAQGE